MANKSETEQRQLLHQQAEDLMSLSRFQEAGAILVKALNLYGPHVGLLSDICAVQYMTQNFNEFSKYVQRLRQEFKESEELLSEESYLCTTLTLGKFCEELMLLAEAIEYYDLGLTKSVSQGSYAGLKQKHEAQKLRLYASLDFPIEDLSNYYGRCLSYAEGNKDLNIELNHALLLAEVELNSPSIAYLRLERILSSDVAPFDARLAFFDFIEVSLRKDNLNQNLREKLKGDLEKYQLTEVCDGYESALLSLLNGDSQISAMTLLSQEHSPFSRLKLMCLYEKMEPASDLLGAYRLLIESVPTVSKKLITQSFGGVFHQKRVSISMNSDGNLSIGTHTLPLKRNSFPYKILHSLFSEEALSVENAIKIVYEEDFSESAYLKLRVSISRLNKLIEETSGIPKTLNIKNGFIEFETNFDRR
jgi:hypothetical protein